MNQISLAADSIGILRYKLYKKREEVAKILSHRNTFVLGKIQFSSLLYGFDYILVAGERAECRKW